MKDELKEMSSMQGGAVEGAATNTKEELKEDALQGQVIDLGAGRRGEVNESYLASFGSQIQNMLSHMFPGGSSPFGTPPFAIRGTPSEIDSFARALNGEKRYIDAYVKYGLDDPRTYRNRYKLEKAVKDFEKKTSIKWPIK